MEISLENLYVFIWVKGLIVPTMRPYRLWNLRNHLSMTKSELCVKHICLLSVIWNLTNNKNEHWKTVKLTSFHWKPQSQSVSIFKFVHQCPLLYLLFYLHILCIFWAVTVDRIIMRFWETTHLPLPQANINTYFSLRGKCWLKGRGRWAVYTFLGNCVTFCQFGGISHCLNFDKFRYTAPLRWCYARRFATTLFSATHRCNVGTML